ncbi:MAG: N-acetylmuramic acid 6-phosphate etherase [Hyphomicrobiaceae bacterium]|nr:N-acetylmuramic acid 6-phosphate etherase [Hyphomicrobiaceae bacterium]
MHREVLTELESLVSEGRNPRTDDIDRMSPADLLRRMNDEDSLVPAAVEKVLPAIEAAVEKITHALRNGGRLIYIGAGTSGRLGVLDASECPPTFGVPEGMVIGLIAGGDRALRQSVEGAEDDESAAVQQLEQIGMSARDVVVGLAVSGRTPYVLGGLRHARKQGAVTVAVTCNPGSPASEIAELSIAPVVGPEVLTGSTRLKSGTAQKLVLNMLTTASMIRLGKAFGNLMVDLQANNTKLSARAARVVMQATGCGADAANNALLLANQDVKLAILVLLTGQSVPEAKAGLERANGVLREALQASGYDNQKTNID